MTTPLTREQDELRAFITGFLTDPTHDKQSANSLTAKVFRIALAAMDSEPVAWMSKGGTVLNGMRQSAHDFAHYNIPLYRHAQPAPASRDERAAFNAWNNEDNLPIAGVRAHNAAWLAWQARAAMCTVAQPAPVVPEEMTPQQASRSYGGEVRGYRDGWNACRAAMLQTGPLTSEDTKQAEPVMTASRLPETQFKQVADLYEMQFDDGRTCAFHTDAEKAVQWLNTCDGNKVQEYVKLERLQEAVSGNSPVIPDGWKLVPVEPNGDMLAAAQDAYGETDGDIASTLRAAILAAAPQEVKIERKK